MDDKLQHRLNTEFIPRDIKVRKEKKHIKIKVIIFDKSTEYAKLNKKIYDSIIIEKKLFDISNEIICYDNNKVAILMYNKQEKV
jgi:hypothetical protein